MDTGLVLARIIHVVGGIFWVGTMVFLAAFLLPSMMEVGPDAAKVMAALQRRKFMVILPIVGVLTVLSGIWLLWTVSSGFNSDYMRSGPGHAYSFGGLFAISALVVGLTVTRPSMTKSMKLAQEAGAASESDRPAILAQAQALRIRGAKSGQVVAWLLALTALAMAVGRYV